ncbi:MAG TPA: DNA-binding domain-containing protein [Burkholderiales bacterium]|nr:DNA-binding domain-containing protein [Burkholderiales bacterium]
MQSLAEWQASFIEKLLADPSTLPAGIKNNEKTQARFAIYQNTVLANQRNALQISYPVVSALVGESCFKSIALAYSRLYPSNSGNLYGFGKHFPEFIHHHPISSELVYLADVAKLEWLFHELRFAADPSEARLDSLAQIPAHELPTLRFKFQTTVRLFHSEFPVGHIWEIHQNNSIIQTVNLNDGPAWLILQRVGGKHSILEITEEAWLFTEALSRSLTLEQAFDLALAKHPEFNLASHLALLGTHHILSGYTRKTT